MEVLNYEILSLLMPKTFLIQYSALRRRIPLTLHRRPDPISRRKLAGACQSSRHHRRRPRALHVADAIDTRFLIRPSSPLSIRLVHRHFQGGKKRFEVRDTSDDDTEVLNDLVREDGGPCCEGHIGGAGVEIQIDEGCDDRRCEEGASAEAGGDEGLAFLGDLDLDLAKDEQREEDEGEIGGDVDEAEEVPESSAVDAGVANEFPGGWEIALEGCGESCCCCPEHYGCSESEDQSPLNWYGSDCA